MKRILQIVLLLSACLIFAASCTAPRKYTSFVEMIANDGVGIPIELNIWNGESIKENCPQSLTCTVMGETHSGTYRDSCYGSGVSYVTDIYDREGGGEFGIRHDTGETVSLNLKNADYFETEPYLDDVPNAEETAVALAKEAARQFLADIDEYKMTVEEAKPYEKEKDGQQYRIGYYDITFTKAFAGYDSSDKMTVSVSSKGHIVSLSLGDTGAFNGKKLSIDKAKVDKSIEEKLTAAYGAKEYKVLSSDLADQKLVLTKDGRVCVYSQPKVLIADANGAEMETVICIITFVD